MNNSRTILIRSNVGKKDLLSSLGTDLKQTRITGYLGYLLSLRPPKLLNLFQIKDHNVISVRVEEHLKTQRCDIIVETAEVDFLIEAKLFYENPVPQLLKQRSEYLKTTQKEVQLIGITNNNSIKSAEVKIFNWNDIYSHLDDNKIKSKILSEELKMHLENTGLVKTETPEIYARELGTEISLNFFLKAHTYYCPYKKSSKIEKCGYFAPHFGKNITKISPGLNYGISYLAQIDRIEYVETGDELKHIVLQHIKTKKLKSIYPDVVSLVENADLEIKIPHIVLLLNHPHHVFNPPIQKDKLQEGYGWLSKQYFTFEDFFIAANL